MMGKKAGDREAGRAELGQDGATAAGAVDPPRPAGVSWRDFDPVLLSGGAADFREELTTYRDHLDSLLDEHMGEYVIIEGSRIVGFHRDRDKAFVAARAEFGAGRTLIKRVVEFEVAGRYGAAVRFHRF